MSSATAIPLSGELKSTWEAQRKPGGSARVLRVTISNEECVLSLTVPKTSSPEVDFSSLISTVAPSEPAYYLFREDDSAGKWLLVAFIPDSAKISDRLVYAATTPTLKRLLGDSVAEEVRFSVLSEFSWSSLQAMRQRVACPSEREDHIAQLDEMEAQARREQEEDLRARTSGAEPPSQPLVQPSPHADRVATPEQTAPTKPSPSPATAAAPKQTAAQAKPAATATATAAKAAPKVVPAQPAAAAKPVKAAVTASPVSHTAAKERPSSGASSVDDIRRAFESGDTSRVAVASSSPQSRSPAYDPNGEFGMKTDKTGGYHTVRLPFTQESLTALRKIPQGTLNFVELKIENEQLCLSSSGTVAVGQLAQKIDANEPRFVFYAYRHNRGGVDRTCTLFIYCCPDKSKLKLRMVYSTSKPSVIQEAQSAGIVIARKIEIRGSDEASQQALTEALYPTRSYAPSGASVSATPATKSYQTTSVPHPVFSKIAGDSHSPGMKKKIVIPPSGAW